MNSSSRDPSMRKARQRLHCGVKGFDRSRLLVDRYIRISSHMVGTHTQTHTPIPPSHWPGHSCPCRIWPPAPRPTALTPPSTGAAAAVIDGVIGNGSRATPPPAAAIASTHMHFAPNASDAPRPARRRQSRSRSRRHPPCACSHSCLCRGVDRLDSVVSGCPKCVNVVAPSVVANGSEALADYYVEAAWATPLFGFWVLGFGF